MKNRRIFILLCIVTLFIGTGFFWLQGLKENNTFLAYIHGIEDNNFKRKIDFAKSEKRECVLRSPTSEPGRSFWMGFAEKEIKFNQTAIMGGYGFTLLLPSLTRKSTGQYDPLFATSMAMKSRDGSIFVLISLDVVGIDINFTQKMRNTFYQKNFRGKNKNSCITLIPIASHTHSSPDTLGLWGAFPISSGRSADFMHALTEAAVESALMAIENIGEVSLHLRTGNYENTSSDESEHNKDDLFFQLRVMKKQTMIGSLLRWSAHPTVLGSEHKQVSADYVGWYRKKMKEKYGGTHLFVNGSMGHVFPLTTKFSKEQWENKKAFELAEAKRIGQNLFAAAESHFDMEEMIYGDVQLQQNIIPISITNKIFMTAVNTGMLDRSWSNGSDEGCSNITHLLTTKAVNCQIETETGKMKIGNLELGFYPGEVFPNLSRARIFEDNKKFFTIGMASDWLGYLLPTHAFCSSYSKGNLAGCKSNNGKGMPYETLLSPGNLATESIKGSP